MIGAKEDVTLFLDPHPCGGWNESSIDNRTGYSWHDGHEWEEHEREVAISFLRIMRDEIIERGGECVVLVDGNAIT